MTQRPMMYIEQPELPDPIAPMQQEYHSANQLVSIPKEQRLKEKGNVIYQEPRENSMTEETVSNETSDEHSIQTSSQVFDQMTMEEKIDYLITPSNFLPKMNCKISIKNINYRGKVLAREGNQIVFEEKRLAKRHLFDLADIDEIKLIGF
ncbi:CotO family spore coat protein [Amphibacillus sp. Q70]|uniref:CotO family spore coat protein n=1 Tax=Amphibacillus sp. Q70 TaxID=3453416 RepID=UPI003F83415B